MNRKLIVMMSLVSVMGFAEEVKTNTPAPGGPFPLAINAAVTNKVVPNAVDAVLAAPAPAVPAPAVTAAVTSAVAPDPQVGKVLMGLASYLQAAKSFRCRVALQVNTEMEGMKQEISAVYDLAAGKPNRLALRYVKGMAGNTVVCDGKKLYIYALSLNRYEEREAPKFVEQLAEGVGPMAGNMLFVDNLLVNDIYAGIMEGVTAVTYVGKDRLDGIECDHLKFVQDQFDWELWLSTGPKPVVVQVVSDMAKSFSGMTGELAPPKGMRMTVLNRFANWEVDGVIPADTFEFVPPPGARKTESLFEGEDEKAIEMPFSSGVKEEEGPKAVEKTESRE